MKKQFALLPAVENAVRFALSGSRCDYHIAVDKSLWNIEADEGQIGQVIQNIVANANESMPRGGTIEISVKNAEIPKGGHTAFPDGGRFIRIAVKDSGIGIEEQYLARIFDPYFTTKQHGSGLGLATSYSIIRNHGGIIEVESKAGTGSTFVICLPACEDEKEAARIVAAAEGRRGRVLLMDDDEIVRDVATAMLETLCHSVECATCGEDAIEKFRQAADSGQPFDIAILDLTVKNGMGGEETIGRLLEIDPGIKAVVSSGYADNPVISDYNAYGFSAMMKKPYTIDAMNDCLNALLS